MDKVMKKIGVTGGFATGKSTVGRFFETLGVPRIDADQLAHQLMIPDQAAWHQILAAFGEEILLNDRRIDRRKLADIIFDKPEERKKLENILHPKIREKMHERIEWYRRHHYPMVILEIPLLYEAGWDQEEDLDAIVVVTADEKKQAELAKKKFELSEEAIQARIKAQLPLEEKVRKADFVIDNGGSLEETQKGVESLFKKLRSMSRKT